MQTANTIERLLARLRDIRERAYQRAIALLPDVPSLHLQYFKAHGRFGRFRRPRRFTEKIQARKLRDRDPRFTTLADKLLAKAFVAERLGPAWVTPTLWHGTALPPRGARNWPIPYALKANHGCGWNLFIRTAADEDWDRVEPVAAWWLRQRYGVTPRERGYAEIVPQLLVEPYLGAREAEPTDYKFHCFHGRVEFIHVVTEDHTQCATVDRDWNLLPVAFHLMERRREVPGQAPARPLAATAMIAAAETLSREFDYVRVDLYEVDGTPLFGEMTFYTSSGYSRFEPDRFDFSFGALWRTERF